MNNDNSDYKECEWCGQDDPDYSYEWRQPYASEPGEWVCIECMEERPWK